MKLLIRYANTSIIMVWGFLHVNTYNIFPESVKGHWTSTIVSNRDHIITIAIYLTNYFSVINGHIVWPGKVSFFSPFLVWCTKDIVCYYWVIDLPVFSCTQNQLHLAKKYATNYYTPKWYPSLYHTPVALILQQGWQIYIEGVLY